eukprot:COSAG02_NODE_4350_length_5463_cov_2.614840_4_plen_171_part_00
MLFVGHVALRHWPFGVFDDCRYFNNLINSFSNLIKSAGAGAKVFELLARSPIDLQGREAQLLGGEKGQQIASPKGQLQFEDVIFSYASRKTSAVLNGVTFTAPPGQVTAIVGSSGAGKSTLFHLIQHFYEPTGGLLTFDGVNVSELDHKWLHRTIVSFSGNAIPWVAATK